MKNLLRFDATRQPRVDGYDLYILDKSINDGVQRLITDVAVTVTVLDDSNAGDYFPPPIQLSEESAQSLMDALWDAGVKPSGGEGHTAHIRALNDHLMTLKKITFKQLGIE